MSLPQQGLSWACLVIRESARWDIKKTSLPTLSAVTFLVCKVFPSVQLGMKRQADALPSKAHWSGGGKIKGTLKVIIKRQNERPFGLSWAQESFCFSPAPPAASWAGRESL